MQVSAVAAGLSPDALDADADSLARQLVHDGKLTKFQATNIYHGRGKGLVFGEYVIFDKLGAGGMGQVYKAQHRRMKRVAALKVLPQHAVSSPKAVQRFYQEVEVAAKLAHPHIVAAYDAGEAHGQHYLAMEYVDGRDLSSYLEKYGPLGIEQAMNVILQAARGLAYAHGLGVVHRDVKPSNLLVTRHGLVKILDMGLARFDNPMADASVPASELTASGEVMGTVDYMAPEQAQDTRTADHRADVYALGCTLYRLLIGKPPYPGETMIQKILAHREQPIPSLRASRPEVPKVLDKLYEKMVAKDVADRAPSMNAVIAALEQLLSGVSEERSSIVLGAEAAPSDGGLPSGKLAENTADLLPMPTGGMGSQIGGFKPGSTAGGMQSAPTQAPLAARTLPTARAVTAVAVEPDRRSSRLLFIGGGIVAVTAVCAALYFAFRREGEPTTNVAAVVPAINAEPISAPTPSPTAEAPRPNVVPIATPTANVFSLTPTGTAAPSPPAAVPTPTAASTRSTSSTPAPIPTATPTPTTTAAAVQSSVASVAPSSSPPSLPPTSTKAGVRVDLLRSLDFQHEVVEGTWVRDGKAIKTENTTSGSARPSGRIEFSYVPPVEYDLLLEATVFDRLTQFAAGLPIQGTRVAVLMEYYPGQSIGLDQLDGQPYSKNESSANGAAFNVGAPFQIIYRVRRDRLSIALNGQVVIDWKGDPRRCKTRAEIVGPDPSKISLFYKNRGCRIGRFELTPVGAELQPAPSSDALTATAAKVKELVGDIPPTAAVAQKTFAAERLHRQAALVDDDALRYAYLLEAVKLATAADDFLLVSYIIEDLRRCFDMDTVDLLNKSIADIAGRSRPLKEKAELLGKLFVTGGELAAAEKFDFAAALVKAASAVIAKTADNDIKKEAKLREQEVDEYVQLFAAAQSARETLIKSHDDGPANLAVGTYLSVVRGDWPTALTHLAKADEAAVRAAAQLETQNGDDSTKAAEIAAAWVEAADKAPLSSKAVFLERARQFFTDGVSSLKSKATPKMLSRLKKVEGDVQRTAGSMFVKRHPLGAIVYGGHWYQFFPDALPWEEARLRCRELGGYLVCIETPAENQWLYQLAAAQFPNGDAYNVCIGASADGHPGTFTWVNGSPFQFADWKGTLDATKTSAGCTLRRHNNGQLNWNDDVPSKAVYICEWDR